MLNYGIVGNCKTCALISKKASVEWMCFDTFSSPSVFAKILDKDAGSFEIKPKGRYKTTQKYVRHTNILETTFTSKNDSFVVIDFMPRYRKILPTIRKNVFKQNRLIRIIKPLKGKPIIKIVYNPKLNYGRKTTIRKYKDKIIAKNGKQELYLFSNRIAEVSDGKEFELNRTSYFVVGCKDDPKEFSTKKCWILYYWTKNYWEKWVSTLITPKKYRELIIRSALTLKLLTFSETGAIIAAATTSIPEQVGTNRTFDYRFCWIRDAAFVADTFKKIGRNHEAKRALTFILNNTYKKKRQVRTLYGIHGEIIHGEWELKHLKGYKNSRPVRIGNHAAITRQNDLFGEIIDIIYLYYVYYEYEDKMTNGMWAFLKFLVNKIRVYWNLKDKSIWEFRGLNEHFVYSKLMCFVGVDRAIKIAQKYGQEKLVHKWLPLRDKIYADIITRGWNSEKRAFTMYYGSNILDASILLMLYHEFLDYKDPRIISTVQAIYNELRTGYLTQRYKMKDDFGVSKSAFAICSFWLVDALYLIGEKEKAVKMFDRLCGLGNHLGLFSEAIDIKTKKLVGNFPQAYTHLAIINSAILLSEWSAKRTKIDWKKVPREKWL
ncbi:glycoside hydrolase family 15 protein [Candidatus Woesearchaeota archaeon]|nr:MAG: glycoside hydrolase family 15 protein [Candidatus Woesearchaeota archaeon]